MRHVSPSETLSTSEYRVRSLETSPGASKHPHSLCWSQALSWCKSVQPTQQRRPRACPSCGHGSSCHSQATARSQAGRSALQSAIYPTDRSGSQQSVFDAGRRLGHGALSAHCGVTPEPIPAGIGQANLVPENPSNVANLQRKIKHRGFCFLSSSHY